MTDRVRVAVVCFNSASVLPGLLHSLPAACAGVDWELVVADNASGDDSLAVVASRAPGAQVVRMGRNAGYAAGINAAAGLPGDFGALLAINPDVRLEPGAVGRMLAALDEPGTGIVVPRLDGADGRLVPTLRRRPTVLRALGEALLGGERSGRFAPLGEVVTDPRAYRSARVADWASGAVMLVSAACLAATGAWDESLLLYSEETEFALRAADTGFRLRYVPAARGVHIGGDAHRSPMLWSLLTVNRVRLFARRHGPVRSAAFRGAVVANEALRALAGRRTSRAALAALLRPSRRLTSLPPAPAAAGAGPGGRDRPAGTGGGVVR
ncbi:MAG TPA: glycosyltransferase family 2 protein [Actinomycetes bacterium]|nr:glycosyltransferase family 2 protein [Actinomycetes bacterium]